MGVIQSSVNQAIGAAGQAAGFVKFLGKQNEIGKDVQDISLTQKNKITARRRKKEQLLQDKENAKYYGMTLRAYRKWEDKLHEEEMAEMRADREEEVRRENELRKHGLKQSFAAELQAKNDLKAHERLRKSPLGGYLNG